ncbi:MAG: hypothetical protein HY319_04210 [Armatimonadetes bacterium]|nr:hypothetical protein [Armatimonadota bacterium]
MDSMRVGGRGATLIAVMLLMTVLLILGMAMLSQKSSQYEAAVRAREAAQARAVAQAGLEDARMKLTKDFGFPPVNLSDDEGFTYTEPLTGLDGQEIGSYRVTLDRRLLGPPHLILQITSVGVVGARERPRSRVQLYAEVDMARQDRQNPALANPDFLKWVVYLEQATPDESVLDRPPLN